MKACDAWSGQVHIQCWPDEIRYHLEAVWRCFKSSQIFMSTIPYETWGSEGIVCRVSALFGSCEGEFVSKVQHYWGSKLWRGRKKQHFLGQ